MPDCEICGSQLIRVGRDWALQGRDCPRCGKFHIDSVSDGLQTNVQWFAENEKLKMVVLSGWVREQNSSGNEPTLTRNIVNRIVARQRPDLRSRAMLLLREIARLQGAQLGAVQALAYVVMDLKTIGTTYSVGDSEVGVLLRLLEDEGLLRWVTPNVSLVLSIKGIVEAEKMAATGGEFTQGFVAMWFNPQLDAAWSNGFDPAIRNAGYRPFRIDKKEYIGGITDEIIVEIRRSKFVVVDYTQQANGVYFEAGFALGIGLAVVPTCHEDQIRSLHFDIRHLNTLPWKTPDDLAANLTKRIVAVVGAGPFVGEKT
jgi:hypothetical protein